MQTSRKFLCACCLVLVAVARCGPVLPDKCGTISVVANGTQLHSLLQPLLASSRLFFDLDETLVMPNTTFIYGLPRSDAFIAQLDPCGRRAMQTIGKKMEKEYYDAHLMMVDKSLPRLIKEAKASGALVNGLTSRAEHDAEYRWHNEVVMDALATFDIQFSEMQGEGATRGVFFAADEKVVGEGNVIQKRSGKARIINQVTSRGQAAVLIDNTLSKLEKALKESQVCFIGIHFTAAYALEKQEEEMRRWFCHALGENKCPVCGPGTSIEANESLTVGGGTGQQGSSKHAEL